MSRNSKDAILFEKGAALVLFDLKFYIEETRKQIEKK